MSNAKLVEKMNDAELVRLAVERLRGNPKTVSFEEMMAKFGICADDLGEEDVEFEIEPIVL